MSTIAVNVYIDEIVLVDVSGTLSVPDIYRAIDASARLEQLNFNYMNDDADSRVDIVIIDTLNRLAVDNGLGIPCSVYDFEHKHLYVSFGLGYSQFMEFRERFDLISGTGWDD